MLNFTVNGIEYYNHNGHYYADNMTIRQIITLKEFKFYQMEWFINNSR